MLLVHAQLPRGPRPARTQHPYRQGSCCIFAERIHDFADRCHLVERGMSPHAQVLEHRDEFIHAEQIEHHLRLSKMILLGGLLDLEFQQACLIDRDDDTPAHRKLESAIMTLGRHEIRLVENSGIELCLVRESPERVEIALYLVTQERVTASRRASADKT